MPDSITAKTGNAPVVRLGHTENNQYGNNPTTAKALGKSEPKDLKGRG